jgi:hypothetical protein
MRNRQTRCSDSKLIGHGREPASPPPSPVARLALPRRTPRQRIRAWRSVACYRSGTVTGFHGIPSSLRRYTEAHSLRTKSKNQMPPYRASRIRQQAGNNSGPSESGVDNAILPVVLRPPKKIRRCTCTHPGRAPLGLSSNPMHDHLNRMI